MRLTELEPNWLCGEEGRKGQGLVFLCPIHKTHHVAIWFANPTDGKPPLPKRNHVEGEDYRWQREGDNFETLTISPSINVIAPDCWHGFIRNGEVTNA